MAKIILLSTGQPATNPRLVKEADALAGAGHKVKAYCSYWSEWALPMDKSMMNTRQWSLVYVGGLPGQFSYLWSRLRHRAARQFIELFGNHFSSVANKALSRTTPELIRVAKRHRADIYIGHNLGALPAVAAGARKNKASSLFDLEDYYTGMRENQQKETAMEQLMRATEDAYIPECDALIAASDGIGEVYQQRFDINPVTILNVFPAELGVDAIEAEGKGSVRMFWFSQTIGGNRGLEDVLAAMAKLEPGKLELHLLGSWQPGFKATFFELAESLGLKPDKVVFSYPPCMPDEIPQFAAQFDIGLALEPGVSCNSDICLSNKMFTYLLAGNAILATATSGQKRFLDHLPTAGLLYTSGRVEELVEQLQKLIGSQELLFDLRSQSLEQGQVRFNWEVEKDLLLDLINNQFHKQAIV